MDHSRQQSQAQEQEGQAKPSRPFDHPRGVTLALRAAANGKVSKNVRARSIIIIIIIRARLGRLQSSKLKVRFEVLKRSKERLRRRSFLRPRSLFCSACKITVLATIGDRGSGEDEGRQHGK